jgi:hypothetical protein
VTSRAIASIPLSRRRQGSIVTPYLLFRRRKESGDFVIVLAPDGRTLVLYLFDNIAAWSGTDQTHDSIALALGTEDLIFRLERTDTNACRAMEQEEEAR